MPRGRPPRLGLALAGALLLATWTVGAGCGTSATDLCNEVCDCKGCSEVELEDCIDNVEDEERRAEAEGCANPYAEYTDCIAEELACRDGIVDVDGCELEYDALQTCLK